jgi:hypothetical protein
MRGEDGSPVFVDPTLFALAMRLPLKDLMEKGVRWVWGGGGAQLVGVLAPLC